jgi:hypothetical protein
MSKFILNPEAVTFVNKQKAKQNADEWFAEEVEKGFLYDDSFTLGLSQEDVSLLTGNFVLAEKASALGAEIPPIVDVHGVPHSVEDFSELTQIMLAYGNHRANLSAEYSEKLVVSEE